MPEPRVPHRQLTPFERTVLDLRGSKTPHGSQIVALVFAALDVVKHWCTAQIAAATPAKQHFEEDPEEEFERRHYGRRRPDRYGAPGAL